MWLKPFLLPDKSSSIRLWASMKTLCLLSSSLCGADRSCVRDLGTIYQFTKGCYFFALRTRARGKIMAPAFLIV